MGSYYERAEPQHEDEIYDWELTGVPGTQLEDGGLDHTPDAKYAEEKWSETSIPNLYASDFGRFYSTETHRFYKPTHGDGEGHKAVKLRINGNRIQGYAHRLLAEAFIPHPKREDMVRHLDGDPTNNDLHNLAWGISKENHDDAVRHGTSYSITDEDRRKSIEMQRHPIIATNVSTGEELYFESQNEASRQLGIPQANIWKVVSGERHTAGGYSFREITREEEQQYH